MTIGMAGWQMAYATQLQVKLHYVWAAGLAHFLLCCDEPAAGEQTYLGSEYNKLHVGGYFKPNPEEQQ